MADSYERHSSELERSVTLLVTNAIAAARSFAAAKLGAERASLAPRDLLYSEEAIVESCGSWTKSCSTP